MANYTLRPEMHKVHYFSNDTLLEALAEFHDWIAINELDDPNNEAHIVSVSINEFMEDFSSYATSWQIVVVYLGDLLDAV